MGRAIQDIIIYIFMNTLPQKSDVSIDPGIIHAQISGSDHIGWINDPNNASPLRR